MGYRYASDSNSDFLSPHEMRTLADA
jgi:hypothetical protein